MHVRASLSTPLMALAALAITAAPALAELKLPAPSPLARVMQTVGVTEVTVEYSSPGVKGRKIFGGLLPMGELWRAGANAATKLTVSDAVKIDGKAVPAGTYAVFAIPGDKQWTLILNKDANQGGTRKYDKKLDLIRVNVTPTVAPARERMTFLFANTTDDSTDLVLEWETTRVTLPIAVPTKDYALKGIDGAIEGAQGTLANAARYYAGLKDYDKALTIIGMSLGIKRTWFNIFLQAQFLAAKGSFGAAVPLAEEAWKLGQEAEYFFWKDQVKKSLEEWKAKAATK